MELECLCLTTVPLKERLQVLIHFFYFFIIAYGLTLQELIVFYKFLRVLVKFKSTLFCQLPQLSLQTIMRVIINE